MPTDPTYPPLADLDQDLAGPPPPNLVDDWRAGAQTEERARALLEPYRVRGTALSCDSSGLTRLSRELDAIQVCARLFHAKRLLHAAAVARGGAAPGGRWVADNAQLFFPEPVPVEDAIAAALATHAALGRGGVELGMCLHRGTFWKIGGGLFGDGADTVELVAEEYSGAGQTLCTSTVIHGLGDRSSWPFVEIVLDQLPGAHKLYRLGPHAPVTVAPATLVDGGPEYPMPFARELDGELRRLIEQPWNTAARIESIRSRFEKTRTIALCEMRRPRQSEARHVLTGFSLARDNAAAIARLAPPDAEVIEAGAELVLVAFPEAAPALEFLTRLMLHGAASGAACRGGLDRGPVLLSHDPAGHWSIMGDAVNVASKQAQELGEVGRIYVSDRLAGDLGLAARGAERFRADVSKVTLEGYVVDV